MFFHAVCRAMTADQLLRAKGEGETSLTNPNIKTRRRFRKLYVVATLHGPHIHGWSGIFVFVCVCMCVCCVCALTCLRLWCFTSLFHWVCVPVILSRLTQVRRLQAGVQVLEAGFDHVGDPHAWRRAAWVRVLSPSPSFPDHAVHFFVWLCTLLPTRRKLVLALAGVLFVENPTLQVRSYAAPPA